MLATSITTVTGWPATAITAAFSLGQLAAALTGIPVGRILDRAGPQRVVTAGSITAAPALAVVACAPNLAAFYAGWILAGVAMGAVLYPLAGSPPPSSPRSPRASTSTPTDAAPISCSPSHSR